jgi:ectoine hydroxylase-related dioxygenase (phytanoyl-CoA dioxygenase family)
MAICLSGANHARSVISADNKIMNTNISHLREQFERDGFLVMRNVLDGDQVAHFTQIVDHLAREERGDDETQTVEIRNAIARDAALLPLLDWKSTFPMMTEIMGWNIQLTTSHVFVRPPTPKENQQFKAIGWHCDGPNPQFPAIDGQLPRMYAKVGFFLTDLSQPDQGNLRVVPGSHLHAAPPERDENGEPLDAIQVLTNPGDAVLFEQRTWHAVGPNYAPHARKNIYIGYCHRWLKAIDFITQSPELVAQANPIQRQLLGAVSDPISFYLPARFPEDVPLKDRAENVE